MVVRCALSDSGQYYLPLYMYIYPTSGERLNRSLVHTKFDFTVDEGKKRLNPPREKNKSMQYTAEGRWMRNPV